MDRMIIGIAVMILFCPVLASASLDEVNRAQIINKSYRMHMPFIENKGQVENNQVKYYARTFGGTFFVEKDGTLTYGLSCDDKGGVVIKETFTEKQITVKGSGTSPTRVNYFKGNDKNKWRTDIPSYESVSLGEIYQGIELTLKAYGNNVEKLYTVLPKAHPESIRSEIGGANELKVNDKGELEAMTDHGILTFTRPKAYQEIDGEKVEVAVSYNITNFPQPTPNVQSPSHPSTFTYGFTIGSYDKSRPLVIDPLLASTFLGGSRQDEGRSIVFDQSGHVYVMGYTKALNFPTTHGTYDESYNGFLHPSGPPDYDYDVFVSKLNSSLSELEASTFIGGSYDDEGYSLAMDGSGNVYVTGYTASTDFPTTLGAYDGSFNDVWDVFVSKLDSNLSNLEASTLIGGSYTELGSSVNLDKAGNVYVIGSTMSSDFPTTPDAFDNSHGGFQDVFISKFNNDLSILLTSTFVGGSNYDFGHSLTFDENGNVYIVGSSGSTDYPTTPGAYDESYNGGGYYGDVFVSKLDSTLGFLVKSTFIGGSSSDYGYSLALDGSGNVYVTGYTASTDFPTTPGAYDGSLNDGCDIFVSKLDSSLSNLEASTFIDGGDYGYSLALDGSGNVYIAGWDYSYPNDPNTYDEYLNGVYDAFMAKLDSTLSVLFNSTSLGGVGNDYSYSLALDGSRNVYTTGATYSSDFPVTTGAYDESRNGYNDCFISYVKYFYMPVNEGCECDQYYYSGETNP